MQPRTNRRFLISDAIVLVAATGLGLAGYRWWLLRDDNDWGHLWSTSHVSEIRRLWIAAIESIPFLSILLFSWTVAILLLRLRGPRPRRHRLWCQPGFLANVSVVLVFVWMSTLLALTLATEILAATPSQISEYSLQGYLSPAGFTDELAAFLISAQFAPHANIGTAILLVWFVTWAAGRWRPEPSWTDRAGRFLGLTWICLSVLAASTQID